MEATVQTNIVSNFLLGATFHHPGTILNTTSAEEDTLAVKMRKKVNICNSMTGDDNVLSTFCTCHGLEKSTLEVVCMKVLLKKSDCQFSRVLNLYSYHKLA